MRLGSRVKLRGVGHVADNSREVIAHAVGVGAVAPAGEGVGVLCVLRLFGSSAGIGRGIAFLNRVCFENGVAVLPCDGVGGGIGGCRNTRLPMPSRNNNPR